MASTIRQNCWKADPPRKPRKSYKNSRNARVEYKAGYPVIRGRGGCVMAIAIDGHSINGVFNGINSPRNSGSMTIDELVSSNDIAAIEIYPHVGNAPGALQPLTGDGSCGLIAIWTGGR